MKKISKIILCLISFGNSVFPMHQSLSDVFARLLGSSGPQAQSSPSTVGHHEPLRFTLAEFDLCEDVILQSPLGQQIAQFLKRFLLCDYLPNVLTVSMDHWPEVYERVQANSIELRTKFNRESHAFFLIMQERYHVSHNIFYGAFDSVAVIFFNELFDIFAKQGFGYQYIAWLHIASPKFYFLFMQKYPMLKARYCGQLCRANTLLPQNGRLPFCTYLQSLIEPLYGERPIY